MFNSAVREEGYDEVQLISRFGVIPLPRHVCYNAESDCHVLPGNTSLPPHNGPALEWLRRFIPLKRRND
jgi:hypothetical protein